jgi:flagellar motility protein MotE (MotC chaperone)
MANVTQNAQAARGARPAATKNPAAGKAKEKKPMSPVRAALIVLVAMLLLVAAAATMVYFNLFDLKQVAVNLLLEGKSPYDPQIARLEELARSIAEESAALEQTRADLEAREVALEKTRLEVEARETDVTTRTAELDERTAKVETFEGDMTQLAAIYEGMDPVSAASICEEIYDSDDIARLLSKMEQSNASAILAAMTPERAARVTEVLMEE